jgi:protein-tyrosine phosphatase
VLPGRLQDAASLDVSSTGVDATFRSTPWAAEAAEAAAPRTSLRVLFVSESGVCRAVLAVAAFTASLAAHGLEGLVEVEAAATRDYCQGEGPDPAAVAVLAAVGLPLPPAYAARTFDQAADVVRCDLVLVMDKFTAADVLREVSVFETINPSARYSLKVRRLGEFHPRLGAAPSGSDPDAQDIDDPLYGNPNAGGAEEAAAMAAAVRLVAESCEGLGEHLAGLLVAPEGGGLRERVAGWLQEVGGIDWLVPPMLQPSRLSM